MKALTILSILIITITSCNCQKKATETALASQTEKTEGSVSENNEKMSTNQTVPVLVYESMSRGYFKKITIENAKVAVQNSRDAKPIISDISKTDMTELETAFKAIDVKGLAELKAPTERRFFDGAPITNLSVKQGDQIYLTPDFDGGIPPAEIKNLVETILKIADKIK